MKLYHKKIGFPEDVFIPEEIKLDLRYSKHAISNIHRLPGRSKILPTTIKLKRNNIIQMSISEGRKIKTIVLRKSYDKKTDIVFVLSLFLRSFRAKVITFWINDKKQKQKLVNKSKYSKP